MPQTIATLKEIKDNENRVGIIPSGAKILTQNGHTVLVQKNAGVGSGFFDTDYIEAGATIVDSAEEIVQTCDILVKVKEPIESEYPLLDMMRGKTLYTYLHLSGVDINLTKKLLENTITAIAYETVQDETGFLPLLAPMSEVAGVLSVQYIAQYLQKKYHGAGVSLGYISGTKRASVVVVGAGVVGRKAAKTAAGMGSEVLLFDINEKAVEYAKADIEKEVGSEIAKRARVLKTEPEIFAEAIKNADGVVGAVLVAGAKAPQVVSEAHVKSMKKGAVIIDVAIDQGGCVWGSHHTTHTDPIFEKEGVIYCCVPNMPGQVAKQSTEALTVATFPYLLQMANHGVLETIASNKALSKGVNTHNGKIRVKSVAEDLGLQEYYEEA